MSYVGCYSEMRRQAHFLVTSSLFIKVLQRGEKKLHNQLEKFNIDIKVRVSFWIYKSEKHFEG